MKCRLLVFLLLSFGSLAALAKDPASTILLHPGDVVYARYEQKGTKLKFISASKTVDEHAQLILSLDRADPVKKDPITFKIVNKFALDLKGKKEMRVLSIGFFSPTDSVHVVAERISLEKIPAFVEELAVFGFELEK